MKYGKEYADLLKDSRIPQEWKESAIEYRQLKKLIKNVVDELSTMGLNPDVLHKILKPESSPDSSGAVSPEGRRDSDNSIHHPTPMIVQPEDLRLIQVQDHRERSPERGSGEDSGEELELEFDSDEEPSEGLRPDASRERRPSRFRVRLSSHSMSGEAENDTSRPVFRQDGMDENALDDSHLDQYHGVRRPSSIPRRTSTARVKAEYVLAGPSDHPTPQIRLVLSTSPRSDSPLSSGLQAQDNSIGHAPKDLSSFTHEQGSGLKLHTVEETRINGSMRRHMERNEDAVVDDDDDDDDDDDNDTPFVTSTSSPGMYRVHALPSRRSRANSKSSPEAIIPTSPRLERVTEASSPIWALTTGTDSPGMQSIMMPKGGLQDLSLGEPALDHDTDRQDTLDSLPIDEPTPPLGDDVIELPVRQASGTDNNEREIIISVPSDVAFFELLCQALNSLSDLHDKQQKLFNEAVKRLCQLISSSITPSSSGNPIKNLRFSTKRLDKTQFSGPVPTEYSKSDLYAWREIFTLWIEAQIFESSSERDRGERSVEEAEIRLKAFAAEVVKRGLGDRRTLRRKESREAWEEFLRLNMLLLDLKRFQLANVNAARNSTYIMMARILKKHDKRTALTASVGFPQFVRRSLDAHMDSSGNINSWTFYNTSLPHVLLASLTDTLLPILPSLDDYMCLICTSIAFKPIRLNCSHLFCVSYMQQWFPLEVKKKQKENELEVAKTEVQDMGLNGDYDIDMDGPLPSTSHLNLDPIEDMSSPQPAENPNVNEDSEIIDRSAIGSPANDLADQSVLSPSASNNLPRDIIGALASTMSDTLQLPTSPPRRDTPILPTYRQGGIAPLNVVRLDTPSLLVTSRHGTTDITADNEIGEASVAVEPVLGKAYSTVIESGNRPVGHRSSTSLRHIVFSSRTTSSTSGVYLSKEGQEDINSSTESFVKVTPPEISPDRAGGGAASSTYHDEETTISHNTTRQSRAYDRSNPPAVLEGEHSTIGRGRNTRRQADAHAFPEDVPEPTASNDISPPESSVFVHGTLPAIPSPSLLFLINLPSTASSAAASSENLAKSYNSAEDPNNLKYWWEAGIRDGDPVGSPLSQHSPPCRQSLNVLGNESRGMSSPPSTDQVASMSISQATPQAQENDGGNQAISQDSTILRPSPEGRGLTRHAGEQISKSDSDESVEQGRELKSSLSDDVLFKEKATVGNALLEMVEREDGFGTQSDPADTSGGPTTWLEPLEMLLHEAPDLELNCQLLRSITTSRLRVKDDPRSIRSVPPSLSSNGNIGILLPEKHVERPATPSTAASVDPSDLHISYETRPWDPLTSNGTYVTFKFLLYLLANTLRCQPQQLPYHPITSYIAKFAMVPELDLRELFSNELSYAVVANYHVTHHEIFLWYKQIFRTEQETSGTFQAVISVLVQVGLELPVEPMEYTLQEMQSNPKVICLLPPGGCSVHDDPENYSELEVERRPQTSYGSSNDMAHIKGVPSRTSKDIMVEMDPFAYDIKEDLDLSSSSDSSPRLSSGDIASSAYSRHPAYRSDDQSGTEFDTARPQYDAEVNQKLNEVIAAVGTRSKGKARAELESQSGSLRGYDAPLAMHEVPVADLPGAVASSAEDSVINEPLFSDSKWNLFNRVLGLLSNTLQITWMEVLKDPRCVHSLIHDAGVSVETFERWVLSAESEEKAEREEAKVDPNYKPWRAYTDFEGRWSGPSVIAAMHAIVPMKPVLSPVSHMAPFQRAAMYLPVENTYEFLRSYHGFFDFEPWSIPNATRAVMENLRTHLESTSGDYLAPEVKEGLKEFVRVQEFQIGSSTKDWQGDEAMDVLQNVQLMMG
ncbi:hypothetical protein QFC21_001521 [Naganishia friedmannii]|uniref:Uncharacterized protein n=1 Tax=Naganishia friedmannii TaxID=89922 RepID=A0ACC2W3R9_9TREE|nr:hypothetical protein QFC21_001521 [Naganishia friedmannii]